MSSTREQTPPRRKRQCIEAGFLDDPSESQPSRRLKPSTKLHSAAFYDSLSKVWLTRRALKELDRRTSQANSLQQPASTLLYVTRNVSNKIQRFARGGGPDLGDLRGYPVPRNVTRTMSSRSRRTKSIAPMSTSSKTKRSSAYDKDFEQHIIDYNIYPEGYNYPDRRITPEPALEEFRRRLAEPRLSLSLSCWPDSNFKDFKQKNARVISEDDIMRDVVPIMCGDAEILSKQNLSFTRLDPIANNTTVDAKPDFYDGARLEDIDKQVREDIGVYIVPTGHTTAPVAPNFFLEFKSPSGGADVAKRQACYNGALGARSMHQLQSYREEELIYDGNPYTITSTYHAGNLNMYTTHVTSSGPGGSPEYHMSQVGGWNTIGDPDTCRRGFTAFRNGRDLAQEQRDAFILAANERASSVNVESSIKAFDHNDTSDPADVQDATYSTQVEDLPYHMSQQHDQEGYKNEPTNLVSDFNGFTDATKVQGVVDEGARYVYIAPSTFESSHYNRNLDTTTARPIEESQTSANDLALDINAQPKSSNKLRKKLSEKIVSKAPRKKAKSSKR